MSGIYSMSTGTRGRRPLVGGVQMSSTTTGGTGAGPVGPPLSAMPTMYQQPMQQKPRKLSVSELMGQKARGGPQNSLITDPRTGQRLTNEQAAANGPYTIATGGGGVGRGRGYGGGMPRQGPISSAGVAGGIPTSQRGRAELAMDRNPLLSPEQAWVESSTPSWDVPRPDTFQPNPRYGNMGRPPIRTYATGTKDSGPRPQVAIVGEEGPEVMVVPPRSAIIPNGVRMPSDILRTALDEVDEPQDGEIRADAHGNEWRYDAKTGRGVPLNPYLGNTLAPTPRDSFATSPSARFNDLSMRLSALRQEGMAEGRAAVARVQAEQAAEQARRDAFLATGKPVAEAEGGGKVYQTPYGPAIVGGNRPKSFTVENFEGGQVTSPDLRAVDRESAADAAERRVRDGSAATGDSLAGYRARPNAVPTAMDEVVGVAQVPEPSPAATAAAASAIANDLDNPAEARGRSFAWASEPVARAQAMQRLRADALDERLAEPVVAPRSNRSRFGQFLDSTSNRLEGYGQALESGAQTVAAAPVNAWDYLFTEGGTKAEREAQARGDASTKALEGRGFKFVRDKRGNITGFAK